MTRSHILHIENPATAHTKLTSEAHAGCWAHDLEAAYRGHGIELETLPAHFQLEDVYRAPLDPGAELPVVSEARALRSLALDRELCQRLEENAKQLAELLRRTQFAEAKLQQQNDLAERQRAQLADWTEKYAALRERTGEAAARAERLLQRAEEAERAAATQRERGRRAEARLEELLARARASETRSRDLQQNLAAERAELARAHELRRTLRAELARSEELARERHAQLTALRTELRRLVAKPTRGD